MEGEGEGFEEEGEEGGGEDGGGGFAVGFTTC